MGSDALASLHDQLVAAAAEGATAAEGAMMGLPPGMMMVHGLESLARQLRLCQILPVPLSNLLTASPPVALTGHGVPVRPIVSPTALRQSPHQQRDDRQLTELIAA